MYIYAVISIEYTCYVYSYDILYICINVSTAAYIVCIYILYIYTYNIHEVYSMYFYAVILFEYTSHVYPYDVLQIFLNVRKFMYILYMYPLCTVYSFHIMDIVCIYIGY